MREILTEEVIISGLLLGRGPNCGMMPMMQMGG